MNCEMKQIMIANANVAVISTYLGQADVERAAPMYWTVGHIHSSYWPRLASVAFATSRLPHQLVEQRSIRRISIISSANDEVGQPTLT
jgi:hypothetical protein